MALPALTPLLALESVALAWALASLVLAARAVPLALALRSLDGKPPGGWRPFATIVLPCRGAQPGLEENVLAYARQAYPAYEVLAVVDGLDDAAVPALERVRALEPRVRIVVSEPERVGADWPSGKMVAQMTGAAMAQERSEVLAFADADGRPGPGWLATLAGLLEDPAVGVSTGFRWYRAAAKPTFWTAARDAWDHIGVDAVLFGAMVWGGSMAVRRGDFARPEVAEEFHRNIADDVAMARAFQRMGKRLAFHPGALCDSPEDGTREHVFEFVVRQVAIMRHAHPGYLRVVERRYAYRSLTLLAGLVLVLAAPSLMLRLAGLGLLAPSALVLVRAWERERMARRVLPALRTQPRGERALTLALAPFVWWFGAWVFPAARRRADVTWRGRKYALTTSPE